MSATRNDTAASLASPVTRAVGYSLLAHCFAYPGDQSIAAVQEAASAGRGFLDRTPLAPILAACEMATAGLLSPGWREVFTLTASPDCPTYETAYLDSDLVGQTHRMGQIAGLYKLFGVEVPAQSLRPDDISVELEFMGFLCRKEVYAAEHLGAPRVAQAAKAQKLFLTEHLGCWAPGLGQRIAARAEGHGFYVRLGVALEDWIEADCRRLRVTPAQRAGAPSLPPAGSQSHGPEFAGPGQVISFDDIGEVPEP
jgi:TorA maturation chaperone TorD